VRRCLKCGGDFDSAHAGNRLCESCSKLVEVRSGAAEACGFGGDGRAARHGGNS